MKKLYYFYHERIPGEIYIDADAKFVGWIHENDASWHQGYMSFIPQFFGGEVVQLNGYDLIDEQFVLEEDPFHDEHSLKGWVVENKEMLLEAIRLKDLPNVEDRIVDDENEEFLESTIVNHTGPVADAADEREAPAKPSKKKAAKKTKATKSKTKPKKR
jgi:hypothetical protein